MKKTIVMPQLREEMKSGILCAWLKEEGDQIRKGEPLFEVETDKVVNRVEADQDGILARILCEEGDEVPVHQVMAELEA